MKMILANTDSTVVEHYTRNPKIRGLNLAAGTTGAARFWGAPGACTIKLFTTVIYNYNLFRKKLECSLASLFSLV
jgi:hypothetical protein